MFSDSIVSLHGHCQKRCMESSMLWLHLGHIGSCSELDSCILYAVQTAPVSIVSSVHLYAWNSGFLKVRIRLRVVSKSMPFAIPVASKCFSALNRSGIVSHLYRIFAKLCGAIE